MKPLAFPLGGTWAGTTASEIDGRSRSAARRDGKRGMMGLDYGWR